MEKYFSKILPTQYLLHLVFRKEEMVEGRVDIAEEKEFLQCSALNLNKGKTFIPHYHVWKDGERQVIAQESWVIIKGSVKCTFFDKDNSILAQPILKAGDISMTFEGGHNYEILEDNTLVYELKTGPYKGVDLDKVRF